MIVSCAVLEKAQVATVARWIQTNPDTEVEVVVAGRRAGEDRRATAVAVTDVLQYARERHTCAVAGGTARCLVC